MQKKTLLSILVVAVSRNGSLVSEKEDSSVDGESPDTLDAGGKQVYMGAGFSPRKDPEHLPPVTPWQHFGNGIRLIPRA